MNQRDITDATSSFEHFITERNIIYNTGCIYKLETLVVFHDLDVFHEELDPRQLRELLLVLELGRLDELVGAGGVDERILKVTLEFFTRKAHNIRGNGP